MFMQENQKSRRPKLRPSLTVAPTSLSRTVGVLCIAASSVTAACASTDEQQVAGVSQRGGQTVITSGPHWRAALPRQVIETFSCPGSDRITVTFDHLWPPEVRAGDRRRRITSLAVNGEMVSARTVAALNQALHGFSSQPLFSPQCFQGRFRVHLLSYENGQLARSEYVDLSR